MRVLAVDPGGTTGFARWERTAGGESIQQWQIDKPEDAIATVRDELSIRGLDVLVCEDFILGPATLKKTTAGSKQTIEMLGVLCWLASEENTRFVLQKPSDAVGFVSNQKLKNLGWWKIGEDHSRSATRHLVLFLARAGEIDLSRLT